MGRGLRIALVAVAIAAGVLFGLAVLASATGRIKTYRIPSPAMEPTLKIGDRILVARFGFPFGSKPERGDIVTFHPPAGADRAECGATGQPDDGHPCSKPTSGRSENTFVKRVVALPGDELFIRDNRAYVNGKPLGGPGIRTSPCHELCNLPKPITVPPGHYYMLGDNRGESNDSRDWGPVPEDALVGRTALTY